MPSSKLEPYAPQRLPLRKLECARFKRIHLHATKTVNTFRKLLDGIPQPERLLSSLLAIEALAALESQKITLSLEDFFILCETHSHKKKDLFQPYYYFCALKRAIRDIRSQCINKEILCSIHQMIKKGAPPHIRAGDYRTKQNWIGKQGCKKEEAYFFPPTSKTMRSAMHNLFEYCSKRTRDPLTQIAIFIAQFLIVHPFMDGNGRTARVMIPLLFYQKKVLSHPLLFFSRYLKDHRDQYLRNLYNISEAGKWEEWIVFFLKGIVQQGKNEYQKIEAINQLYLKLKKKCLHLDIPPSSLFFLFSRPIFTRSLFLKRYSTGLFADLIALKIIRPFKKGYWIFPALFRIIKSKNPGR